MVIINIISVCRQLSSCNRNPSNPEVSWCVRRSCCGRKLILCRWSDSKCGRGWRTAGGTGAGAGAGVPAAIARDSDKQPSVSRSVNRIRNNHHNHQKIMPCRNKFALSNILNMNRFLSPFFTFLFLIFLFSFFFLFFSFFLFLFLFSFFLSIYLFSNLFSIICRLYFSSFSLFSLFFSLFFFSFSSLFYCRENNCIAKSYNSYFIALELTGHCVPALEPWPSFSK